MRLVHTFPMMMFLVVVTVCTDLSLFTDWRRQCDFHGLGSPRILWACSRLWPFTSSLLSVCVICEKPREKTMSSHISRILHLYNHGGGETLISKQSIKYFAPIRSYHQHYIVVLPFLHIICIFRSKSILIDWSFILQFIYTYLFYIGGLVSCRSVKLLEGQEEEMVKNSSIKP